MGSEGRREKRCARGSILLRVVVFLCLVCALIAPAVGYVKPGVGYGLMAALAVLLIIVEINRKYR